MKTLRTLLCFVALASAAASLVSACGGTHRRVKGPPPEYEEPGITQTLASDGGADGR